MSLIESKLENLERRLDLINDRLDAQKLVGGDGILVRKSGNDYTISANFEESVEGLHPWALKTRQIDDKHVEWSTYGGLINNVLGDNFTSIKRIKIKDKNIYYVYYHAKMDFMGLSSFDIKMDSTLPSTELILVKNAAPIELYGLIGIVQGQNLLYQIIKTNLTIRVRKEFSVTNLDGAEDNYYRFEINE